MEPARAYVVTGAPAAGKSVLGAALARHVRGTVDTTLALPDQLVSATMEPTPSRRNPSC